MVITSIGKFTYPKKGKTGVLYIPADITKDSQFPLLEGEVQIEIRSEGDQQILIVKKLE